MWAAPTLRALTDRGPHSDQTGLRPTTCPAQAVFPEYPELCCLSAKNPWAVCPALSWEEASACSSPDKITSAQDPRPSEVSLESETHPCAPSVAAWRATAEEQPQPGECPHRCDSTALRKATARPALAGLGESARPHPRPNARAQTQPEVRGRAGPGSGALSPIWPAREIRVWASNARGLRSLPAR